MSRHTPSLSESSTWSITARSSWKLRPTSEPLPAMVSKSTVVAISGRSTAFRAWAMRAMPASAPCFTWLPGWKLYMLPGMCSSRARSSAMVSFAKARRPSSAAQAFRV